MAGAKPGVHVVQLKPISVPEELQRGNKFIMWNDNSTIGTPVTLKVDEKGYFLYWRDQNKEMDCLDISVIRDTRTGKYAKVPKDSKLKDSLMIGRQDMALEDKTVTIYHGNDMVTVEAVSFVCSTRATAQLWTTELLKYSVNLLSMNTCSLSFLHKWYTRTMLMLGTDGKIPVKNIIKQVANNREDRRKVEKALEAAGLAGGKAGDSIDPNQMTFEKFFNFYHKLIARDEVEKIFADIGAKKKPYLTVEQFTDFLKDSQRDPRLNEILYPFPTKARAQEIVSNYESKSGMAHRGHLSLEGFLKFLMSEDNNLIPGDKLDLSEDMSQPLAHYFINSSHNTYLTGHQLTGKSSVEMYRQVLLSGCRCIELDCWDGKTDEEPMITHGYTMCTDIPFKDVIEAIAESAFKTSDFPVILSFENHCSPRQQAKMAQYCRTIFGEMLLDAPLDSHPLKPGVPLPSPNDLKRRIIIKNKKKHLHKEAHTTKSSSSGPKESSKSKVMSESDDSKAKTITETEDAAGEADGVATISGRKASGTESSPTHGPLMKNMSISSYGEKADDLFESDSESSDSDEEISSAELSEEEKKRRQRVKRDKGTAGKEAEAASEMSALVNYIQPIHFHSFEASEKRNKSCEISSFVETQGTSYLKEFPVDFVNYNKRQLSRIYPRGTRVDSSNFMPQVFWNAGCQLVALNFQTLDLAMQLNLGIFEYNGRSGYILKPDFMRRFDRHFDPFAESTVDGIVAGTVSVKIISGQFLSDKRVGTYVEVDMYGLPTDTVRKKFRTKAVSSNGLNPVYDEEPFVFKKVVLPNLATLRLGVYEETGKLIGFRILPLEGLRPGYRHIPLRNECNQPLMLPTLFVLISVGDYVPDQLAAYADALLNPIAYISKLEKHAQQLEILTEDFESDYKAGKRRPTIKTSRQSDQSSKEEMMEKLSRTCTQEEEQERGDEVDGLSPMKTLEEKMQQRQNSVNRAARRVDMSPTGEQSPGGIQPGRPSLNRMTSTGHMGVSKQESTQSVSSQNSNSSGGNPMQRMQSTYLGENGSVGFAQNSKLNDPAILTPTPLEELKTCKAFQKALAKRDKELENLQRKHEKARENLREQQLLQLDKLIRSQTRDRIALEKSHTKSLKKIAKCGKNVEEKQLVFKGELQEMLNTQDHQHREMKYQHIQKYVALTRDQYQAEMDLFLQHHEPVYEALAAVMASNHECHQKALDEVHGRDVVELQKAMDPQFREQMKMLAKKHKDKQELSRIKREAQQKHVGAVVTERQRLKDILAKRKEDLQRKLEEVCKEAERDKEQAKARYLEEYDEKCEKLQEMLKAEVQALGMDGDDIDDDNANHNPFPESSSASRPTSLLDNGLDNSPSRMKGSYVSIITVNGSDSQVCSPVSETSGKISPDQEDPSSDNVSASGKVNSQEELTSM